MGLKSFSSVESEQKLTFPNALTATRAIGGIALGFAMATNSIGPNEALVAATALATTDLEGVSITAAKRFPRIRRALRIIPSTIGRITDPIADKIFTTSVFIGGMINGDIPLAQGASIFVAEGATVTATAIATSKGEIPEVSKAGTWGMVARCGVVVLNLAASAETGTAHDILAAGGAASAVGAVALGLASAWGIYKGEPSEPIQAERVF